ncbi:hypothetical protein VB776_17475 [Arcicella sp. DC2W]|uniref:Outer membrane protein beta-barrel domain-containing protein n=1 Tax=Arcicella gelida TaxID=2984195 RepID=A0ABU5S8C5_9BACT|nr:hypothetical protein [Arcicella sp. DC2W]MEA5404729.1 hypothetical protein [Arcicella sp. DC2W]
MSEQESENIGKVFKNAIEEISMAPPNGVWESLRMLAIQTQLARYKGFTTWLSFYSSIITILLGGAIYLLLLKNSESPATKILYKNQLVNIHDYDTIFVDRVKYVYVKEKNDAVSEDISTQNLANNSEVSNDDNHGNRNQLFNTNPKLLADDQTFTLKNKDSQHSNNNISTSSGESVNLINSNSESISPQIVRMTLKKLDYKPVNGYFNLPKIAYHQSNKTNPDITIEKPEKPKIPLMNRIAISAFYSPEYSNLTVYRSEPEAFNYGNEQIAHSNSYGLRASIDINPKLSISTGIEWANIQFASSIRKFPIQAELVNGKATYLYKTVFGVATIPTEEMTTVPAIGNPITLESEDEHTVGFIRLPLSLQYNAFQWKLKKGGRNQRYLSLYGSGGISYNLPSHQKLAVEIYEADGHDYYTTLGNFKNTQSFWAYNLAFGAAIDLTHNASFWIEPNYNKTIDSFVRDLPLKSYIHNLGVRFGVKWHF